MRLAVTLRLLRNPPRLSHAIYTLPQRHQIYRKGYCTACEPEPKSESLSTANPPTPAADHRQLAIDQELYINSVYSPGSPIFLPNGTKIFNRLTSFLREQYARYGFDEVISPTIYKKSLWEKSGHWENYADDMYTVTGRGASGQKEGRQATEEEEYGLKPMNCPGHCLIFASKKRSYRELPIRYADFSPLHRNELHGALSGLTRVRRFHQDDGHIFCRPSQIRDEISKTLEFVAFTYESLGLGPYRLALSTRPADHFIGTVSEWDNAESALKESLNASGQTWTINEGDGAFYGPKIDVILKDSDGKEHQTATIQLDFQLPKRFELEYQAPAPEFEQRGAVTEDPDLLKVEGPVTPVLIHRAVLGSVERIMALLIEHYNGHWPLWLNPRQMIILTVNNSAEVVQFAQDCIQLIQKNGNGQGSKLNTVDLDSSPRSLKKKISEAKRKRYSLIAVIGNQEAKSRELVVDFSAIADQNFLQHSSTLRVASAERNGISTQSKNHSLRNAQGASPVEMPIIDVENLKSLRLSPAQVNTIFDTLRIAHK